jgi:hypothetical protein
MVDIEIEADLLHVERLGAVHVCDREQHQLEHEFHDAVSLRWDL